MRSAAVQRLYICNCQWDCGLRCWHVGETAAVTMVTTCMQAGNVDCVAAARARAATDSSNCKQPSQLLTRTLLFSLLPASL